VDLPHVDPEARDEIVEKAHKVCPYSNATRGNIEVRLVVPAAA
jgi:organic hydroperoxide reductase OsmC/OhrA